MPGTIMQPRTHLGISLQYHVKGPEGKGLLFHVQKANFPEYTPDMEVYLPAGLYVSLGSIDERTDLVC